ncbi:MAG TPA: insulinase family protein, partial [bacterium]|nr:insulinase family protein [bacterium]
MMTSVRSDEGLAYNVYSYFEPKRDRGLFIAEAETKTESTLRAISLMKNEIRRICEEPVSEQELTTAKDSYLNRFVFNFTTTRNIVEQRVELEYEGLPEDYLDTFCDKVSKVTQDDILRVAKKWLHPDSLRIMIVGNAENFGGAMSDLGTVREMTLRDYAAEADSARKPR